MKKITILIAMTTLLLNCSNDDDALPFQENNKLLVTKVYDYQNRLLADYVYNENNQLRKRNFTDPTTGESSELLFNYVDNKLNEIEYINYTYPDFNNNMFLFYNASGKIIRSEIFKNGNMINHINYEYAPTGRMTHMYKDNGNNFNYFDYDTHGNIAKVTNCCAVDQVTGESIQIIRTFNYDTHKKPSFNLDGLFQIDLLPKMGSGEVFERNISCNNMTSFENGGTTWTYEYNDYDLPISILIEVEGIVTEEPMLLKIEYSETH